MGLRQRPSAAEGGSQVRRRRRVRLLLSSRQLLPRAALLGRVLIGNQKSVIRDQRGIVLPLTTSEQPTAIRRRPICCAATGSTRLVSRAAFWRPMPATVLPTTWEKYILARRDRVQSPGHTGCRNVHSGTGRACRTIQPSTSPSCSAKGVVDEVLSERGSVCLGPLTFAVGHAGGCASARRSAESPDRDCLWAAQQCELSPDLRSAEKAAGARGAQAIPGAAQLPR